MSALGRAQTATDSLPPTDSLTAALRTDSLRLSDSLRLDSIRLASLHADSLASVHPPVRDTLQPLLRWPFGSDSFYLQRGNFFNFSNPVRYTVSEKKWEGKEVVFYILVGLLLLFAFIKNSFPRYLPDLFSTYFRTTVRQKQLKEQLLQSPLPSLLFNFLFVMSAGVFTALLAQRYGYAGRYPFALLALYCAAGLAIVYGVKFLLLKVLGWVFQLNEAANAYIFVVFATNKVLGIFLLPFSILLAFTTGSFHAVALTLGIIVVVGFFAYRYFLAFITISHLVRLNLFHFLLYLAAFEVLPLLLINKALLAILPELA